MSINQNILRLQAISGMENTIADVLFGVANLCLKFEYVLEIYPRQGNQR